MPRARDLLKELAARMSVTRVCLGTSNNRMKQYADQKQRELEVQVRAQVLLSTKNEYHSNPRLKVVEGSSKLLP